MALYRNILRHGGVYSISVVVSKAASVLLLPLYTRYLSPSDYGIMELLELTSYVVTVFIGFNLGDAFFYFYRRADDDAGRHAVISTAFIGGAGVSIVGAALALAFAGDISQLIFRSTVYTRYFHITFVTMAFLIPSEIGLAYLRVREKSHIVVGLQCLRLALSITLNVIMLTRLSMGVSSMLISALVSTVIVAVVTGVMIFRHAPPAFDLSLFRKLARFAFPLGVSGLGMLCLNFGDRFFLQRTVTLGEIGLYALAYKLGMLVSYIQLPFSMYWSSQMYKIVDGPDGAKNYVRICTYLAVLLTAGALVLSVLSRPFVQTLAAPSFGAAAQYVPAIALAYLVRGVGDYFRSVFLIEKRTGVNAIVTLAGVLACLACYSVLIPRFRLWGAVFATVIGFAAMGLASLVAAQRVRAFQFEYRRIGTAAGTAVLCWWLATRVRPETIWVSFACGFFGFALWLGVLFLSKVFTGAELRAGLEVLGSLRYPVRAAASE